MPLALFVSGAAAYRVYDEPAGLLARLDEVGVRCTTG
jgi:hypothetical protein